MAIFAGDIPSCLLRMPGTPASAAYTDEAYAMTKKGQGEIALGAGLVFSVIGGLFGTAVLILAAPALAEVALKFSSFEYFWLVLLGLLSAVFLAIGNPLKGVVSLLLGLLVSSVGLDNPAGFPRFTFGNAELAGGLTLIPIMIGMFAVSEILRNVAGDRPAAGRWRRRRSATSSAACGTLTKRYPLPILRGSVLGTAIGALPGAGADIAAWMSLRDVEEILEGAGEVRHRPRRGHRRGGRVQQQRARRRLDPGAGVRHSGRLDHRDRDRRALHQGPQSRADASS